MSPFSILATSLAERIRSYASDVDAFAVVRALERALPREARVGGDASADREAVHFTHPPDFTYPAADIVDLLIDAKEHKGATLVTTYLGLLGTESPLPPSMGEDVLFENELGGLQAFYDVWQHRTVALLYRAWKRFAPFTPLEASEDDVFGRALQSLVGTDAFGPDDWEAAVEPMFALGLSDFVRCDPNYLDREGLECILARLVPDLNPRVGESSPRFVPTAVEDASVLGEQHMIIGVDAAYGAGALDPDGVLRITVGPVRRSTYEELMPGGVRYRWLRGVLEEWLASRASIELEVITSEEDAPFATLGEDFGGALGVDAHFSAEPTRQVRTRVLLVKDDSNVERTYHVDQNA